MTRKKNELMVEGHSKGKGQLIISFFIGSETTVLNNKSVINKNTKLMTNT